MEQLIRRWNEYCEQNNYEEVIYPNEGLDALIEQVYGVEVSHTQASEIAHNYQNGSYTDGCRWWWLESDGSFGGAYTVKNLPIDFNALNKWCVDNDYEITWENEDE